jgi:hypothetical protein
MKKSKKYIVLPLLLALLLLTFVPGCKDKETTEPATTTPAAGTSEFTQEQMQQIFADAIKATKNAQTYKFDINLTSDMEATGGAEAGNANMSMNATGVSDQTEKKMHTNVDINMSTNMNIPGTEEGERNIAVDMYTVEDTMYVKTNIPFLGDKWLKVPANAKTSEVYNSDIVSEQLKMLESPAEIKFLRYETVDGDDCYVFQVVPDIMKIVEWLGQQQMTGTGFDAEKIKNIADAFKNISFDVWIARDGGLMRKVDGNILMDLSADESGASGAFDNMKMNMTAGMRLYDYNVPVTIELPEEALNAIEMPAQP